MCQLLCFPTIFTNRNGPSNCWSHQRNDERIHCVITPIESILVMVIVTLQTNQTNPLINMSSSPRTCCQAPTIGINLHRSTDFGTIRIKVTFNTPL